MDCSCTRKDCQFTGAARLAQKKRPACTFPRDAGQLRRQMRPCRRISQPRTVPLKRLKRHSDSLSTLAFLVACRGPSVALGGHCPRAGVRCNSKLARKLSVREESLISHECY